MNGDVRILFCLFFFFLQLLHISNTQPSQALCPCVKQMTFRFCILLLVVDVISCQLLSCPCNLPYNTVFSLFHPVSVCSHFLLFSSVVCPSFSPQLSLAPFKVEGIVSKAYSHQSRTFFPPHPACKGFTWGFRRCFFFSFLDASKILHQLPHLLFFFSSKLWILNSDNGSHAVN